MLYKTSVATTFGSGFPFHRQDLPFPQKIYDLRMIFPVKDEKI